MGRQIRAWWPLGAGLVLVSGALLWVVWAYQLPVSQRSDALVIPGFVVGLVGVLLSAVPALGSFNRPRSVGPAIDVVAARLAEAVNAQWRQEAIERRLVTPQPIPLTWSLSHLVTEGSVAADAGVADIPAAFPPLPGQARVTAADLWSGGGRAELYGLYSGLASGRVVVIGGAGAGKSASAILLLLDALAQRELATEGDRARLPVPILLTAHGWNPTTTSVQQWLVERLTETYPVFWHRGGHAEAAELVAARDRVALILDGFDEMDSRSRIVALRALSDAPFRVVVLTRGQEISEVAARTWLAGAIAIDIRPISPAEAMTYLERARIEPPPVGWEELLAHLRNQSDNAVIQGLCTPLALTLLRDTYRTNDDVRSLLDRARSPHADSVEDHLIARVIPTAYTAHPGRPVPRYGEQRVTHALVFIARQLGCEQDFEWWRIRQWAPLTPRCLATGLVAGLAGAFTSWLAAQIIDGIRFDPSFAITAFISGLLVGIVGELRTGEPPRGTNPRRAGTVSDHLPREVSTVAIAVALATSLSFGVTNQTTRHVVLGVTVGAAVFLVSWLLNESTKCGWGGTGPPLTPHSAWRNARTHGLIIGLIAALASWSTLVFTAPLTLESGERFVISLPLGLICGLGTSVIWPTRLSWIQLQLSRKVPFLSFMSFLEDARKREVLRTVGTVYQFRHAKLQDHLAMRGDDKASRHRPP